MVKSTPKSQTKRKTSESNPPLPAPSWVSSLVQQWRVGAVVAIGLLLAGVGYTFYQANQSSVCPSAWFGQNHGPITHQTDSYSISIPFQHWYEVNCQSDAAFDEDGQEFMAANRQPGRGELVWNSASMSFLQPIFRFDPANVQGKTQAIRVRVATNSGQTPEQLRDQMNLAPTDQQLTDSTFHRLGSAEIISMAGHPTVTWESEGTTYYDAHYSKEYFIFSSDKVYNVSWTVQSKTELERSRYVKEFADEANTVIASFKIL